MAGGAYVAKVGVGGEGGHAWRRGCMVKGVCVVKGGMHGEGEACMVKRGLCMVRGGHARQEIWPLQQTVRILLECILVRNFF